MSEHELADLRARLASKKERGLSTSQQLAWTAINDYVEQLSPSPYPLPPHVEWLLKELDL